MHYVKQVPKRQLLGCPLLSGWPCWVFVYVGPDLCALRVSVDFLSVTFHKHVLVRMGLGWFGAFVLGARPLSSNFGLFACLVQLPCVNCFVVLAWFDVCHRDAF